MMHYGFCRKHADQTGEGGCPECAMDHQQATISAMTETAKESSRVHVEMHNQITALQAEVADLKAGRVVSFARIKILETQMANLGVEYAAQVKDQAERIEWMETNLQAILETAIEDGPVTTDWLVDRCNEALAWDDPHGADRKHPAR